MIHKFTVIASVLATTALTYAFVTTPEPPCSSCTETGTPRAVKDYVGDTALCGVNSHGRYHVYQDIYMKIQCPDGECWRYDHREDLQVCEIPVFQAHPSCVCDPSGLMACTKLKR